MGRFKFEHLEHYCFSWDSWLFCSEHEGRMLFRLKPDVSHNFISTLLFWLLKCMSIFPPLHIYLSWQKSLMTGLDVLGNFVSPLVGNCRINLWSQLCVISYWITLYNYCFPVVCLKPGSEQLLLIVVWSISKFFCFRSHN